MEQKWEIGEVVMWRGSFGRDLEKPAVIRHIDFDETSQRTFFDLDNGYWCYEYQIRKMEAHDHA